ncbi:MAG: site-specific integrase [Bacteroidota bacterium]
MSSLYERDGVWQIQYTDLTRDPKQRRFSLKTDSRRTAERLRARADVLYESGAWDPWTTHIQRALNPNRTKANKDTWTLSAARERFLGRSELASSTRTTYAQIIDLFLDAVGNKKPGTLAFRERTLAWLDDGSEGRKATYVRHLRTFERWSKDHGLMPGALELIPKTRAKNRPKLVYFEPEEIEAFCETLERESPAEAAWIVPVVRADVYLGLRLREATAARVDWYDAEKQRLVIPADVAKARKDQALYVPARALPVVEERIERSQSGYLFEHRGRQINAGTLGNRFRFWRKRAGLEAGSFHTLRHTCASWLAQGGAPLNVIQAHLRHANIQTTMRYVHLMPRHEESLIETAFMATAAT